MPYSKTPVKKRRAFCTASLNAPVRGDRLLTFERFESALDLGHVAGLGLVPDDVGDLAALVGSQLTTCHRGQNPAQSMWRRGRASERL
jgi:hypothetical protein